MEAATLGQDGAIDTIGGKNTLKATTLEASTAAAIVAAMQSRGVRRLVIISMVGEGASVAKTNCWERLLLSKLLRAEMKDKAAMEAMVDASGLDCPPRQPRARRGLGVHRSLCVRVTPEFRTLRLACLPQFDYQSVLLQLVKDTLNLQKPSGLDR